MAHPPELQRVSESCNSNHCVNQSEKQHLEKRKHPQCPRWIEDEQWKTRSRGHWLIRVNKGVDSSLPAKTALISLLLGLVRSSESQKVHANKNVFLIQFHIFKYVYLHFSKFKRSKGKCSIWGHRRPIWDLHLQAQVAWCFLVARTPADTSSCPQKSHWATLGLHEWELSGEWKTGREVQLEKHMAVEAERVLQDRELYKKRLEAQGSHYNPRSYQAWRMFLLLGLSPMYLDRSLGWCMQDGIISQPNSEARIPRQFPTFHPHPPPPPPSGAQEMCSSWCLPERKQSLQITVDCFILGRSEGKTTVVNSHLNHTWAQRIFELQWHRVTSGANPGSLSFRPGPHEELR